MGVHSLLKKFNLISLIFFFYFFCSGNLCASLVKLPQLSRAGILPVNFEASNENSYNLSELTSELKSIFIESVKSSGRFRLLEDSLVEGFWKNEANRRSLVKDYELDCYLSLTIVPQEDSITLVSRILGPNLEIYLQEIAVEQTSENFDEMKRDMEEKTKNLVYTLINRLPVDVYLNSIQGKYVTLSGGRIQGVRQGEEFEVFRHFVSLKHPANHSWLSFDSVYVGKIKVIEVSDNDSIAKIKKINKIKKISLGDGIKVENLHARAFFNLQNKKNTPPDNVTALVDNLVTENSDDKKSKSQPAGDVKSSLNKESPKNSPKIKKPLLREKPKKKVAQKTDRNFKNNIYLPLGQKTWLYTGPGQNKSNMLWYLPLNSVGLYVNGKLTQNIAYEFGGSFFGGQTDLDSTYLGYEGKIRSYWSKKISILGSSSISWGGGGSLSVVGLGLSSSEFGGFDLLSPGVFFRGDLSTYLIRPIRWFLHLEHIPYHYGLVGYQGKKNEISNKPSWNFELGFVLDSFVKDLRFGLAASYRVDNLVDKSKEDITIERYSIDASMEIVF